MCMHIYAALSKKKGRNEKNGPQSKRSVVKSCASRRSGSKSKIRVDGDRDDDDDDDNDDEDSYAEGTRAERCYLSGGPPLRP